MSWLVPIKCKGFWSKVWYNLHSTYPLQKPKTKKNPSVAWWIGHGLCESELVYGCTVLLVAVLVLSLSSCECYF